MQATQSDEATKAVRVRRTIATLVRSVKSRQGSIEANLASNELDECRGRSALCELVDAPQITDKLSDLLRRRFIQSSRKSREIINRGLLTHPPTYLRLDAAAGTTHGTLDVDAGHSFRSHCESQ